MPKGEIRSLTGLRGVAACVVMGYHYANLGVPDPLRRSPLGPGYLMVDLFFILSGFVMARTYGAAFHAGFRWPAYRNFLEARIARVYPLYGLVTIAVFLLLGLVATVYPTHPLRALVTNLLLVQNLGSGLVCTACSEKLILPAWSVSTEAGAYLAFPLLASFALFRSRRMAATLTAVSVLAVILLSRLPLPWLGGAARRGALDISEGTTLWPVLRCLAEFCIGMVLWRASRASGRMAAWRTWPVDGAVLLLLAGLWVSNGADLALVALFAVLIWYLCTDASPMARQLGRGMPYRAGEWSYAIYLLHWPALMVMPVIFPIIRATGLPHAWSATLLLMVIWTIVLSGMAHIWVERPARRELRAFFHRRVMPIALEPSVP